MILDSLTVAVLAAELTARHQGLRIRRARADEQGLDVVLEGRHAADETDTSRLHLQFGPTGAISLGPAGTLVGGGGRERYLEGARIESIAAVPGDRALEFRLSREDADSRQTHGVLHVQLFPPYYRAVLVSSSHGRILGVWASAADRWAPAYGSDYLSPAAPPGKMTPGQATVDDFAGAVQKQPGQLAQALRLTIAGADRHLAQRLCVDTALAPDMLVGDAGLADLQRLWQVACDMWTRPAAAVFCWQRGQRRLSVVEPSEADVQRFSTVTAALQAPAAAEADPAAGAGPQQRQRLRKALRVLQRRAAGLQGDLDETEAMVELEHRGNSVLAAADQLAPGTTGVVANVHSADSGASFHVELAPGESAVQHGTRLLRRVAKLRRRTQSLPPRLHRAHELILETEALLAQIQSGTTIEQQTMQRWERRVEVRLTQEGKTEVESGTDQRQGARPRRYLTSTGWSVWAGRNNQENDIVTHRLAAQNDMWFHAHGYAGSHVILRREGRKEEPDGRTLEEAAAVAAYWSKGRTANKVPVVYTLAKFVSKPRGAPAGLAVMKREKTIMVRPDLLTEEESS